MSKTIKQFVVEGPKSEKLSIRWYEDGSVRFCLQAHSPCAIRQAYLTKPKQITIDLMPLSK